MIDAVGSEDQEMSKDEGGLSSSEDKYVLWAKQDGYIIQYATDKHGEKCGQQLVNSDDDAGKLLLWNYSENLLKYACYFDRGIRICITRSL
ncbi:hypothetical protein CYMTET_25827 [Cymbomonas tetramitiformis]|uniref:Uncharacterized protein n=1 Tax=Cymbomonas tetramitiformis TaxID=36881 RepID=A0AAE0FTA2_9CHLO|nr:hypothetical protein CYMTET_25827 [Cymbomonas tetramitiformis]